MQTPSLSSASADAEPKASWLPMIVIAMAQIMMIFNVSTLQVSIDGIASSFNTSATTVGTAYMEIGRASCRERV